MKKPAIETDNLTLQRWSAILLKELPTLGIRLAVGDEPEEPIRNTLRDLMPKNRVASTFGFDAETCADIEAYLWKELLRFGNRFYFWEEIKLFFRRNAAADLPPVVRQFDALTSLPRESLANEMPKMELAARIEGSSLWFSLNPKDLT